MKVERQTFPIFYRDRVVFIIFSLYLFPEHYVIVVYFIVVLRCRIKVTTMGKIKKGKEKKTRDDFENWIILRSYTLV